VNIPVVFYKTLTDNGVFRNRDGVHPKTDTVGAGGSEHFGGPAEIEDFHAVVDENGDVFDFGSGAPCEAEAGQKQKKRGKEECCFFHGLNFFSNLRPCNRYIHPLSFID